MKSIKKYTIYLACLTLLAFSVSCEPLEDVNENPNNPADVPTSSLLAASQKKIVNSVRGTNLSANTSMLFIQYFGHNTYTDNDRYQINNTYGATEWNSLYAAITNLNEVIRLNTDASAKIIAAHEGDNNNQIAVCRILKAWTFQIMTDMWGDIPYCSTTTVDTDFEACLSEKGVIYPKYAPQEKIYKDMLKELKEAAAMINTSASGFKRGDAIFGGDMMMWKKLANSLSLRIANRVKAKLPEAATRITEIMGDATTYPIMQSNADNALLPYELKAPNQAPFYMYTTGANRNDYSVSNAMVDCMKGTRGPITVADPRLPIYAKPATSTGTYVGQPYGVDMSVTSAIGPAKVSFPGTTIYAANFKEVLMEYAEVQFLLSENNGWSQTNYINGIQASMLKWGVSAANIASYIAAVPAAGKENVLTQKWIALYMQPQEAWSEYRRTGYPNFLVTPNEVVWTGMIDGVLVNAKFIPLQGTAMPRRIFYPNTEQQLNKDSYQAALAAQGNDVMDTRVWWDK